MPPRPSRSLTVTSEQQADINAISTWLHLNVPTVQTLRAANGWAVLMVTAKDYDRTKPILDNQIDGVRFDVPAPITLVFQAELYASIRKPCTVECVAEWRTALGLAGEALAMDAPPALATADGETILRRQLALLEAAVPELVPADLDTISWMVTVTTTDTNAKAARERASRAALRYALAVVIGQSLNKGRIAAIEGRLKALARDERRRLAGKQLGGPLRPEEIEGTHVHRRRPRPTS